MKTPGEAAMDLPWLAPSVGSLTTLAQAPLPSTWTDLRSDPGFVLLSARSHESFAPANFALLEAALQQQTHFHLGFVDWSQPGPDAVYRVCCRQALLASQLAEKLGVDAQRAWIAAFLAPLGWVAVTAAEPGKTSYYLDLLHKNTDAASWQRQAWGHDHAALTRRLCRRWRLPTWLATIIGQLGLDSNLAERLGAEPKLHQLVQLAVLLTNERGHGLGLPVGAESGSLLKALRLNAGDVTKIADAAMQTQLPARTWESPAKHALLPDLLRIALENRRQNDAAWIERLQQDLDHLQEALALQCADEQKRLHSLKLSSLAEFAAGAGHEINNPLAVISGQAQYVLKQMDWLDVPAEEIDNVRAYLDGIRTKVTPSLHKIIAQTQRIHMILRELMQFARPHTPKTQAVAVQDLIKDTVDSLQTLATERKVRLVTPDTDDGAYVHADPTQASAALSKLLRNAIEAAPAEGWAGVRIEKNNKGEIELLVEDSGKGPCPTIREHLFDPFFSGRSAGRGRGMGLPIAWRLARQQGGEVRFDGIVQGLTRFVLTLPIGTPPTLNGNGYHTEIHLAAELAPRSASPAA